MGVTSRSAVRGQKAEVNSQKSEIRGQRSTVSPRELSADR
jgi:hypothetical protein